MISFLLALAAAPAVVPETPATVDLVFRTQREFALALPAETWSKLGQSLPNPYDADGPFLVQDKGGAPSFDTDGDGSLDVTLADKEGLVTFRTPAAADEPARVHSIRLRRTGEGWVWSTSGSMVGKLGNIKLQLIDQNNNGRYDDVGVDAMIVGRGNDACFLSEAVCVAGELLQFQPSADGTRVALEPFSGPTGTLDLVTDCDTQAKLAWAVVKSADGRYSFDLSKARGGQLVPAGSYQLERGRVGLGKNHAQIHRGRSQAMVVPADGKLALEWGGPVKAEFAYERAGSSVQFSPTAIDYYGTFGEVYRDFMPLGKSPEFSVKDRLTGEELVNAKFPGNC